MDLVYLAAGAAMFALFAIYAVLLRRVWPWSSPSSTSPPPSPWRSTCSRPCCAPKTS